MFARFVFLFAMCLGLAVAPVRAVAGCAQIAGPAACGGCCAAAEDSCCAVSDAPVPPSTPAKVAPSQGDAKLVFAPALHVLGFAVLAGIEPPAAHRQHAARIPAQPRIFKTCIRLI